MAGKDDSQCREDLPVSEVIVILAVLENDRVDATDGSK
jgi:hypothetical protein